MKTTNELRKARANTKVFLSCSWVFLNFLVIARNHSDVYGRHLMEIDPKSLPHLSKQLGDLKHRQKTETNETQNFKNINKSYFLRFPPIDISSCINTQLDMQNSILKSKNTNSFNQGGKIGFQIFINSSQFLSLQVPCKCFRRIILNTLIR